MPSNDLSIFHHENLRPRVPRSVFDLGHRLDCDMDFGKLYPVYLQDCVPNDTFTIGVRSFVRSLPLEVPVLTRIRLRVAFYYVPYYLLWHKFDRFIFGGRDGKFTVDPPVIDYSDPFLSGSLADYLGFPTKSNLQQPTLPKEDWPSAFPFLAYQRIYRDYYLNQDLQTDSNVNAWFPADDFDFQAQDGVQSVKQGSVDVHNWIAPAGKDDIANLVDGGNAINLTAWRYRNWSVDYYTGCMFSPQRGPMQALPVSGSANLSRQGDWVDPDTGASKSYRFVGGNEGDTLTLPPLGPNVSNVIGAYSSSTVYENNMNIRMDRFLSQYGINGSDLGTFTIDDIRLATRIQEWLERNMRTKAQYNESLRIHFGDAPLDERLTKPYFIGATSQDIVISEVLQTSESTSSSPLGSMAGHGISSDSSYVGKFHSHEFGLIMGIASIMPDTSYIQQGIPREWSKRTRYDYYFPEFAQLSPQPVLNKELYAMADTEYNNKAFGYIGRFDEMRFRFDRVAGSLANPAMADYFNWTMARRFSAPPTLHSKSFLSSDGTVRHDAWTAGDTMSPFIAEFAFNVRAVRPLPVANIPTGLL